MFIHSPVPHQTPINPLPLTSNATPIISSSTPSLATNNSIPEYRRDNNEDEDEYEDGNDDEGVDMETLSATQSKSESFKEVLWDRTQKYTDDGVNQLRSKWQTEYADRPMRPPPPAVYLTRSDAVEAAKDFACENGYRLIIGHSYKDKEGTSNRILLKCQHGGKYRNLHSTNPEARQRKRVSRKTNCPMKIRIQKRRFSSEWVLVVANGAHNHVPDSIHKSAGPAEHPELETALHDWHMGALEKGDVIHGNTLTSRALALWAEMPQYRGMSPPSLDRAWLDAYRKRYNLPGRIARPAGPPELVDWNDAEAVAAAINPPVGGSRSREIVALNTVEKVFENDNDFFQSVKNAVKSHMSSYDASHDWDHILRVLSLAKRILRKENQTFGPSKYDPRVVYLAVICHDISDHKYLKPGEDADNRVAELLLACGSTPELALKVQVIAKNVSFSKEIRNPRLVKAVLDQHIELGVVQDADRLDAIGALGIGRTFLFNGAKTPSNTITEPIALFQEKVDRLESMMKTEIGRTMAHDRIERLRIFRQWWDDEYEVVE